MLGALLGQWEPRLWLAALGFLLFEVSIAKLINRCSPHERLYHSLRASVGDFLSLVCQLNGVALALKKEDLPESRNEFENIIAKMRQKVERIAQVPGKTDAELNDAGATGALPGEPA